MNSSSCHCCMGLISPAGKDSFVMVDIHLYGWCLEVWTGEVVR